MRLLPMGPRAVLVEDPPGGPAAWSNGLRATTPDGLVDVVPAASTVLVTYTSEAARRRGERRLETVQPSDAGPTAGEIVIPVRYDGPDLALVADHAGLTIPEVVAAHSDATYRVAFCGFAPGFGYLAGLPERLHVPRRDTPRTSVPAGAVAIAADYTAVYPRSSPGGWQLVGSTDLALFDPERDPPALLAPGTSVRFVVR